MKTILFNRHDSLGAKIVDFNGWEMPIHYKGILHEHKVVREEVGIFDVSHMGRISIKGPDAEIFLDFLSTNTIANKADGTATYTVLADEQGGSIDDVIIYRNTKEDFFVVVNAGNRDKDLLHLQNHATQFDVSIQSHFQEEGILAIQGPKAEAVLKKIFPDFSSLRPFHFLHLTYDHLPLILSKTGYTGSGGAEIYAPHALIIKLWDLLLEIGKEENIEPIGLGARDTLRLEMGYALYDHELTATIPANESVSAWTVKFEKKEFLGKEALQKIEHSSSKRHPYGIVMVDKGIPRAGYDIYFEGTPIGIVTSGTHSPSLNIGIALILTTKKLNDGDTIEVMIRSHPCKAKVTPLPFYRDNRKEK